MIFDKTTKNKRRVYITLHHRDDLSLPRNRKKMGYGAYNWAIVISPKVSMGGDCFAYDVTNVPEPDSFLRFDSNPNREWRYRQKPHVDPTNSSTMVKKIMIGKLPNDITYSLIQSFLESIPILQNDTYHKQTGVRWIIQAIQKLQDTVLLADKFSIRMFMDEAIKLADERLQLGSSVPEITDYTKRPPSTDYSDISID
ncbi:uncharacterized protein N7473_002944 [Penicillium subrubescens]|uniref:Uncharacterized protein n=1 Tax=Penicillium subrubescens TaxID=1316194 RepID=A0A1Q5TDI4_9EURO|nr:uncharacterized protein N7473_002944 [Penicillium subrubescens]KAJ5906028.1 hypothetical protein N7473_002944 [Penicillium subrubescens]OKO98284.1 hypothetical protein PENSUB_9382 [Penicillium subrubescens]